jgi:hypothetical protein
MAPQKKGRTRANGEGSITRRKDGRYDCELPVYAPEGTKRLRTAKKTKAEADDWLTAMKYERNAGTPMHLEADKMTFGEYLDRWLRDVVKGSVARHTYKDYEGKVRLHLKPTLGRVKLKDLTLLTFRPSTARKPKMGFLLEPSSTYIARLAKHSPRPRSGISYERTSPATSGRRLSGTRSTVPSPSLSLRRSSPLLRETGSKHSTCLP